MWVWSGKGKLLDYAEHEGRINAEFHIACASDLHRYASILLAVLLSGAGGGLGLFVSLVGNGAQVWLLYATVSASVYLFSLSALLVVKCLMTDNIYAPANEPGNLYGHSIRELGMNKIREYNLKHKQEDIKSNIKRNDRVAMWLNRVQIYACITPVLFAMSGIYFYLA